MPVSLTLRSTLRSSELFQRTAFSPVQKTAASIRHADGGALTIADTSVDVLELRGLTFLNPRTATSRVAPIKMDDRNIRAASRLA